MCKSKWGEEKPNMLETNQPELPSRTDRKQRDDMVHGRGSDAAISTKLGMESFKVNTSLELRRKFDKTFNNPKENSENGE